MTNLTGTEKQIAWADEIRMRVLPMVAASVQETLGALDPNNAVQQALGARYEALVTAEMGRTDATYWIKSWNNPTKAKVSYRLAPLIKQARKEDK